MEPEAWREMVAVINSDIRGIVKAQRVLSDVHDELEQREAHPIEEDFIYGDGFGQSPREPRIKTIDGVDIEIRVLHRRGLRQSDIMGADLLYEIAGHKFVLVQYKSPNRKDRVVNDSEQLHDLVDSCPNPCSVDRPSFWPTCGSWYAIRAADQSMYLPACEAVKIFGDAASRGIESFGRGVSADVFEELFARCWTGARIAPVSQAYFVWSTMERDRVLFSILQNGSFGRW